MPLTIPDEVLKDLKMDEREARIEIACRLYDAGKLGYEQAAGWAQLGEREFYDELDKRNIECIYIDEEYWRQEVESLERWERTRAQEGKIGAHESGGQ